MPQLISPRLLKTSGYPAGYVLKIDGGVADWEIAGFSGLLDSDEVISEVKDYLQSIKTRILPASGAEIDIGSVSNQFRHLYISNEAIFIGNGQIKQVGDEIVFVTASDTEIVLTDFDSAIVLDIVDSDYIIARAPNDGPQGVQGITGDSGDTGFQGVCGDGIQGIQGIRGDRGPQGVQGFQGICGVRGNSYGTGAQGPQGIQGPQGTCGLQGVLGDRGPQGVNGTSIQGFCGFQGAQGFCGPAGSDDPGFCVQGIQGIQGIQELQGIQGCQGCIGGPGPQGICGLQGLCGFTRSDAQGVQGLQGFTGIQGPQGTRGCAGDIGLKDLNCLCDYREDKCSIFVGRYACCGDAMFDYNGVGDEGKFNVVSAHHPMTVPVGLNHSTVILGEAPSGTFSPASCSIMVLPESTCMNIGDTQCVIAIGRCALSCSPCNHGIIAIGTEAGLCAQVAALPSPNNKIFIGGGAGLRNQSGFTGALACRSGSRKEAIGIGYNTFTNSCWDNGANIAIGYNTLGGFAPKCQGSIGRFNIAIGAFAAQKFYRESFACTTICDDDNIFIGHCAGCAASNTIRNIFIGYGAGRSFCNNCNNIVIGEFAGSNLNCGDNNILLGAEANASNFNARCEITLGNFSVNHIYSTATSISSLSDCRDKKNISDLCFGINFINSMNPVSFTWDHRDSSVERRGLKDIGFIAQELEALESDLSTTYLTRMILNGDPDRKEAAPLRTYPIAIQALRELATELDQLEAEVDAWIGGQP